MVKGSSRLAIAIVVVVALTAVLIVAKTISKQQQEREHLQTLEEFFPEMADFESIMIDEGRFETILNEQNDMLGVAATVQTQGYKGQITYMLAVDVTGDISNIKIVSHEEAEGKGSAIEEPWFQESFVGKSFLDPIWPGLDMDTISGATVSSSALINSVRETIETMNDHFSWTKKSMIDVSAVSSGTYRGSAEGYKSEVVVEVVVDGGKIIQIEAIEHGETTYFFDSTYEPVKQQIINTQKLEEVDVKTGATKSAEAIVKAVLNALEGQEIFVE